MFVYEPHREKTVFCICENKDADQLRGNREADQRLCFRYTDSKIPLLSKSKIASLSPSSVAEQPGLCRTWSETPKTGFSQNEAHIMLLVLDIFFDVVFFFFFFLFSFFFLGGGGGRGGNNFEFC